MSRNWPDGWLYLPFWWRVITLLLCGLLLAGGLWLCLLRPVLHQAESLSRMQRQQSADNRAILQGLLRRPPLLLLMDDIARLENELSPTTHSGLSLTALIARSGGTLETWKPDSQGGELTMQVQWRGFLAALQYLRELSAGMPLAGFTLRQQKGSLVVRLSMVLDNDL